jgi:hypothetical protein
MKVILRPSWLLVPAMTIVLIAMKLAREHVYGPFFSHAHLSGARGMADMPPDWFLAMVWVALTGYFLIARFRNWHVAVNEWGIEDNYTLSRLGFIPWEDIDELTVVPGMLFTRLDMFFRAGSVIAVKALNRRLMPNRDTVENARLKPQRTIILDLAITSDQAMKIRMLYQQKSHKE